MVPDSGSQQRSPAVGVGSVGAAVVPGSGSLKRFLAVSSSSHQWVPAGVPGSGSLQRFLALSSSSQEQLFPRTVVLAVLGPGNN